VFLAARVRIPEQSQNSLGATGTAANTKSKKALHHSSTLRPGKDRAKDTDRLMWSAGERLVMQARTRLKPPNPEAMLLAYIRPGALHSKPSKAAGDTPVQLCTTTCSVKNQDYLHPKIDTYGGCACSEGPGH